MKGQEEGWGEEREGYKVDVLGQPGYNYPEQNVNSNLQCKGGKALSMLRPNLLLLFHFSGVGGLDNRFCLTCDCVAGRFLQPPVFPHSHYAVHG